MDKKDLDKLCINHKYSPISFGNVVPAKLYDFKLEFNYYSAGRCGGAANIMESKGDCTYGLLIQLKDNDLDTIRCKEGHPTNYGEISVNVQNFENSTIHGVLTYKVMKNRELLEHQPPTPYYLGLIIYNANKYDFPSNYVKYLESIKTKD